MAFYKSHFWGLFYSFYKRMILKSLYYHSTPLCMSMTQVFSLVMKILYNFGNCKQTSKISEIHNIEIGKDDIKRVDKQAINEILSWNQQYKIIEGKLKGGLNSIRNLRVILPKSHLSLVYEALVESHLGNLVWGHLSEKKLSGPFTSFNPLLLRIRYHPHS